MERTMLRNLALLAAAMFCGNLFASSVEESPEWNAAFKSENVNGVFILCKNGVASCRSSNRSREKIEFTPASTFKIANALIALEAGVVADQNQVFKWGGEPRGMKQWEKDFNLRGAMQASVVPVFQQFARDIGEQRMKNYVHKLSYGNESIAGGIDHFWLDGGLKISAWQQLVFLEKLYQDALPVRKENQLIVKDALVSEVTPEYLVRSKTGYSLGAPGYGDKSRPGVAWWVGWVEKGTDVYFFAVNIDVEYEAQLPVRKSVPIKILKSEGIL
jgi:beta-lactamase class D OXA-10